MNDSEREPKEYDVLVLGGGTAGTAAAANAQAELGPEGRVAMFNKGELGGLCILRGCMPTKTMLHAAHLAHEAGHHHTPGVGQADLEIDFGEVMQNQAAKVARFKAAKLRGIANGGYEVIDAFARFAGEDLVEADGELYRFTSGAVIASGSRVSYPNIEGLEALREAGLLLDSDDVMKLTERPASAIVLGGGAIGLELGLFLARMGTQVYMTNRSAFYSKIDADIAAEMAGVLEAEPNLTPLAPLGAKALRVVERPGGGRGVAFDVETGGAARTLEADVFVCATGRDALLEPLALETAGVERKGRGLVFDEAMRTTNPRIFVAGDATGDEQILHVANWEGKAAGLGAAGRKEGLAVERRLAMAVVFTDPPLATIGMTETEAREAGHDPIVVMERFPETGRAITMDVQHGCWKLVVERSTGEVLGSQILGPRADDLVHAISTIMYYDGTVSDMLEMPWYHPTLSEVALSLARSAERERG